MNGLRSVFVWLRAHQRRIASLARYGGACKLPSSGAADGIDSVIMALQLRCNGARLFLNADSLQSALATAIQSARRKQNNYGKATEENYKTNRARAATHIIKT